MLSTFEIPSNALDQNWSIPRYRSRHQGQVGKAKRRELREIADIASGMYMKDYSLEGVPYLRVDNVRRYLLSLGESDLVFIPAERAKDVPERCMVSANDVVISRTGTLGKAAFIVKSAGSVMSQHVSRLRIRNLDELRPGFLCCYLNSVTGRQALIDSGAGSTRLELTHESLGGLLIPMMPLKEQIAWERRVIGAVTAYENAASQLRRLVEEADSLLASDEIRSQGRASVRSLETFSVSSGNVREMWNIGAHKPEGGTLLKAVGGLFTMATLRSLARIERGKGVRVTQYAKDGIPFVRTSSLIDGLYDPLPDHFATKETYNDFNQIIEDGDILYSMEGRIGEVSLLFSESPVVFKNHIQRIRLNSRPPGPDGDAFAGWLYLVLRGVVGHLQAEQFSNIQSTIPGLGSRLGDFLIPVRANAAATQDNMMKLGAKAYRIAREAVAAGTDMMTLQTEFESAIQL